ncbi:MAG: A/G-specific adenine glycosylase, partial [Candidatus Hydrogenedentes bacterium]|nr:A/G-specific adenine glycosylase [Candidatus Hydrogenedentota bacterium]
MQQAPTIRKSLLRWFREEARDLPWRKSCDPYHVWLSEILLQQTRVDQGLPYYERFLVALPTLPDLAAASEDDVLKLWEGLGYYTRARNLHRAARQVMDQYDGRLPEKAELLQMLPGVGRYTAGAIASIAFGERAPVVDGNVKRVLTRLFNIAQPIEDTATDKKLWAIADSLVPASDPGDFNQGMMELGARICTPKKPDCGSCPIVGDCASHKRNLQEKRPVRKPRKAVPHREIVVAVIARDGEYLIGKRGPDG